MSVLVNIENENSIFYDGKNEIHYFIYGEAFVITDTYYFRCLKPLPKHLKKHFGKNYLKAGLKVLKQCKFAKFKKIPFPTLYNICKKYMKVISTNLFYSKARFIFKILS